ncbi:hypothetical protein QF015_001036 [Paenarthrobacter sp. TE4293]|uniref:hypothetical protein n=1 Tax=Paenarthrobacter sp. TE4293 TaxID=3381695 RepID=UPI003D1D3842
MAKRAQPTSRGVESWLPGPAGFITLAAFLTMAAAGCSPSLGSLPCSPPEYHVDPSFAKRGDTVTVSAPEATCNPRYGPNAQVHIVFTDAAGADVLNTTAPMTDAGGFTFTAEVPVQTASGVMAVKAEPHGVDWCDDTGTNNRAHSSDGELERASCAEPMKPLTITK